MTRSVQHAHRGRRTGARRGDAGSATLLVLGLAAVLLLAGALAAALAAVAVARHRAASAADLAALAGASSLALDTPSAACTAASAVAGRVGAVVVRCAAEGAQVEVQVSVRPEGPLGRLGAATARARAGPTTVSGRGPGA